MVGRALVCLIGCVCWFVGLFAFFCFLSTLHLWRGIFSSSEVGWEDIRFMRSAIC
jgi:hypothetical protein